MGKDLRALAADLRKVGREIPGAAERTSRASAEAVRAEAVRRSSGNRTAEDRRRADSPFATRHGSPRWDASTVNVGRDVFRREWAVERRAFPGGGAYWLVLNRSRVGAYLERGTPTMFARPLREVLEQVGHDAWRRTAPAEFARALSPAFVRR